MKLIKGMLIGFFSLMLAVANAEEAFDMESFEDLEAEAKELMEKMKKEGYIDEKGELTPKANKMIDQNELLKGTDNHLGLDGLEQDNLKAAEDEWNDLSEEDKKAAGQRLLDKVEEFQGLSAEELNQKLDAYKKELQERH